MFLDRVSLNIKRLIFPDGSERQFSSPGYNLPIGLLMRAM